VIFNCADPAERAAGLHEATLALRGGSLVVMPTDTVYGLAADAFRSSAVDLLLSVKGRGRDVPVPVLVSSRTMLEGVAEGLSTAGVALADAFWPGPLTLVTRHSPGLAWDLGETRGTVAVRLPLHPLALDLIAAVGPLAVSSANRTGLPPASNVTAAEAMLGEDVEVYLDAGACADGVPSSIVDVTSAVPRLLRLGAIPLGRLQEVVPELVGVD